MPRLLLVEDHAAFRGALALVLNLRPGMEVVAECGSVAGCRTLGGLENVDVALVDLLLPDGDGTELVAPLRRANPGVKVLVLSAFIEEDAFSGRLAGAGADGVLDKTVDVTEIAAEVARLAGARGPRALGGRGRS